MHFILIRSRPQGIKIAPCRLFFLLSPLPSPLSEVMDDVRGNPMLFPANFGGFVVGTKDTPCQISSISPAAYSINYPPSLSLALSLSLCLSLSHTFSVHSVTHTDPYTQN